MGDEWERNVYLLTCVRQQYHVSRLAHKVITGVYLNRRTRIKERTDNLAA